MASEYYEEYYYEEPAIPAPEASPPLATPSNGSLPFFAAPSNVFVPPDPLSRITSAELDEDEKACIALLRGVPIFAHLSDEGLQAMVENGTVRHFQKGEPIIAEGSRSSGGAATPQPNLDLSLSPPQTAAEPATRLPPSPHRAQNWAQHRWLPPSPPRHSILARVINALCAHLPSSGTSTI